MIPSYKNPETFSVEYTEVASTDWFKFSKKEPGQPGVFEIDSVPINDDGGTVRRFAFWNGRTFGPAANNPVDANTLRFGSPSAYVTVFRGLIEQA